MSNSIEALDLPLQYATVGSVLGMTAGLIQHARAGEHDRWSAYVAAPSTLLFFFGVLQTVVGALC